MKTCNKCGIPKNPETGFYKDSIVKSGYRGVCIDCDKATKKAYREANPERYKALYRKNNLMNYYGITPKEWDDLLDSQGGRCAICRTDDPQGNYGWQTDHNHTTKRVRGILCHWCNISVGHVESGWTVLVPAIEEYLKKHS